MEFYGLKAAGIPSAILSFVKKPVIVILIIGLIIRLVLAPFFTYDFDMKGWALVIENINSGNGLYDLAGYYYTPVWGYFIGLLSTVQDLFLNIDVLGIRFTDLLPIEALQCVYHTATTTTVSFNLSMKLPLILCDVLVGYLIYWLIKDRTNGDSKKATWGFALWFLCPTIIYMSGIQAQFDTLSALLLMLTIIAFYKDRCFLGGMLFAMATLTKFFPAFCIFVFAAYIIVKHRDDKLVLRKLLMTVLGGSLMALAIMMPQILDGTVSDAMSFMFGRMETYPNLLVATHSVFGMIVSVLGAFYFGYRMYKTDQKDADTKLFDYLLFALTAAMMLSVTPQYMIVMMPMLIFKIMTSDRGYLICWILISLGSFFAALSINNFSLLTSSGEFLNIVSPEWIISMMQGFETEFLGFTGMVWANAISEIVEYIGLILILAFCFEKWIGKHSPKAKICIERIKRIGWKKDHEI